MFYFLYYSDNTARYLVEYVNVGNYVNDIIYQLGMYS